MRHPVRHAFIVFTLILSLISMTSLSFAAEDAYDTRKTDAALDASAEAMLADLFFLRPIGIAATVVGSVVWFVALPFTLPTKSEKKAAEKLVVDPAKYTFARPLGQN